VSDRQESPIHLVGLYAYDFGPRTSIGYTADEVVLLSQHPEHIGGTILRVQSVDTEGRCALRGVTSIDLSAESAMLFGHGESGAARETYDALVIAAKDDPPSCPVTIELGELTGDDATFGVMLIYRAHSEHMVSCWLTGRSVTCGDRVVGGAGVLGARRSSDWSVESTGHLTCRLGFTTRDAGDVLASVGKPFQR
jgi:hypothetical protein